MKPSLRGVLLILPLFFCSKSLMAQSSLALSSNSAAAGSPISLNLTLATTSGSQPAALEWTFTYPAASVSGFVVSPGPVLTAAGKTLSCAGSATNYICIASGINSNLIANGTVATVTVTLAGGASSAPVGVSGALGATMSGGAINTSASGGTATATGSAPPTTSQLNCSPASLSSNTSASCTVTLSKAAGPSALTVSLSSNNGLLSVPASTTVAVGATTATFTATAGSIASDQSASVTATVNSTSQSTSISLQSATGVSVLTCSPTSLTSGNSAVCTVTLSRAAATGGAAVSLTSNNPVLAVAANVTIPAGSTTGSFSATAGAVLSNSTAIVTASLNGRSQSASISLGTATVVSQLSCAPSSLASGTFATCTVTLSKAAGPTSATVSVTSGSGSLTVPPTVTIPAGSTSATFSANAASIGADQTVSVIASLNGGSQATAVSLVAPNALPTLTCSPTNLSSGGSANCVITLSRAAGPGPATVNLTTNNGLLTVPASVTIASGSTSASFTAAAGSVSVSQTAIVTITYSGSSQSASFTLNASGSNSIACTPGVVAPKALATCTVTLATPAGPGGAQVVLSSSSSAFPVPPAIMVPAGSTSASFAVSATNFVAGQTVVVTAVAGQTAVTFSEILQVASANPTLQSASCDTNAHAMNSTVACKYTLSAPVPQGGSMRLGVSSDNPSLIAPSLLLVNGGLSSGTFQLIVASVSSDQTGSITITDGLNAQTITIALLGPPSLSSVFCNPPLLTPNAALSCTVTLNRAATADSTVALTATPDVRVPVTVTVPLGSSIGNFTAMVGAAPGSSSADITASLNGVTRSFTLSTAPIAISSLTCSPDALPAGATASCAVALASPAPSGGITLLLASNSPDLTAPAVATVPAGSTSALITVTAGTPTVDEPATLTASFGSVSKTATFTLQGAPAISSLACDLTTLMPGTTTNCKVTLSKISGASSTVMLTSSGSSAGLSMPASVAVPSGSTFALFALTAPNASGTSFQITATLGSSSQVVTINVGQGTISSLSCNPDLSLTGTLNCAVGLAQAPAVATTVTLQADNTLVQLPAQIQIPAGVQSAQFTAGVLASDQDAQVQITAGVQGGVRATMLSVIGIRPTALVCSSLTIQAGDSISCTIRLNTPNIPQIARLAVSSSNPSLQIPESINSRPSQRELTFKAIAKREAGQTPSALTVKFGTTAVSAIVIVTPSSSPVLSLPGRQLAMFGSPVSFTFSAVDPGGLPLVLTAGPLPGGASFDPGTGNFSWTPDATQSGSFDVTFTATNSSNVSSTGDVVIQVDGGKPVISTIGNAASQSSTAVCSPGSAGTLSGRWLAAAGQPATDPSGASMQLGGSQVNINGNYVPVLYASATRVDFLCPTGDPGALNISVETGSGNTDPVQATMTALAPGVFSLNGTGQGQGMVTLSGTSLLATSRAYNVVGQPAEPADSLAILVTGMGSPDSPPPMVTIGGVTVGADSVQAVPGFAGVYQVVVKVPAGVPTGDAVPVVLQMPAADGSTVTSNTVTIAIEPSRAF